MTKQSFWMTALIAGLGQVLFCLPSAADEKPKTEAEQKIAKSLEKIVFKPHDVGAPEVTDAGGVRGISAPPKLSVLAPERLSLSLSPSPTLYWYASKGSATPVRFTLLSDDPNVVDPVLEVDLGAHAGPGIYAVPLAHYGVRLDGQSLYSWSVSVASTDDALSAKPVSQTWLEHSPSADIASSLLFSSPFEQVVKLAGEGYWYDAINVVSQQIEAGDRSVPWREIRARLLDQIGLQQIAVFDRQSAGQ